MPFSDGIFVVCLILMMGGLFAFVGASNILLTVKGAIFSLGRFLPRRLTQDQKPGTASKGEIPPRGAIWVVSLVVFMGLYAGLAAVFGIGFFIITVKVNASDAMRFLRRRPEMKPSILPASRRGVSRQGFIPEDVIPASRGGVSAEAMKDKNPTASETKIFHGDVSRASRKENPDSGGDNPASSPVTKRGSQGQGV